MTYRVRLPALRAAEALVILAPSFPAQLNVTAGFASATGAIEIQIHDSHLARVGINDGFRLAGRITQQAEYDFTDAVGQRHHHWRGVYNGLAVTVAWVETRIPEGKNL